MSPNTIPKGTIDRHLHKEISCNVHKSCYACDKSQIIFLLLLVNLSRRTQSLYNLTTNHSDNNMCNYFSCLRLVQRFNQNWLHPILQAKHWEVYYENYHSHILTLNIKHISIRERRLKSICTIYIESEKTSIQKNSGSSASSIHMLKKYSNRKENPMHLR